jgi:hypothetical protein
LLDPEGKDTAETSELKAKAMVEKKSTINLLEAFAVAVKHYLRGEDGIYYKFVPVEHENIVHLLKWFDFHQGPLLPRQVSAGLCPSSWKAIVDGLL